MSYILDLAKRVKIAQTEIATLSMTAKNKLLDAISEALVKNADFIITENKKDLANAKDNGISEVMVDRLTLNVDRINAIANAVLKVKALPDPIGEVLDGFTQENGLYIVKKRVPLGVVGVIFESRPNVTVDVAVLCLKSSNAAILRGGKEAINTNIALGNIIRAAIKSEGINEDVVAVVADTSRETATEMMKLNGYLDVIIPRGGASLIKSVIANATVPVIETGTGNCHIYIDSFADLQMGSDIVYNAKVSRPSTCNACESVLVHKDVASAFLPIMKASLDKAGVTLLGCSRTIEVLGDEVALATKQDYATEFSDLKLSIKVVESLDQAIAHIREYTTYHSEAIITSNLQNAARFTNEVDAAAVYVNASTRFTDGEIFGLGAEIGISTQKLHARGPMGLKELTSTKFIIQGNGEIR